MSYGSLGLWELVEPVLFFTFFFSWAGCTVRPKRSRHKPVRDEQIEVSQSLRQPNVFTFHVRMGGFFFFAWCSALANKARLPHQAQACTQKQTYLLLVLPSTQEWDNSETNGEAENTRQCLPLVLSRRPYGQKKKGGGNRNRRKGTDAKQKKRRISPQPLGRKK